MPLDSKLVRTTLDDVLIFCTVSPTDKQQALEAMGVRVERLDPPDAAGGAARISGRIDAGRHGGVSLAQVLDRLGQMNILSVMFEAGGQLNSSALGGGHVDKLTLFYAPVFLGPHGVPLLQEAASVPPFAMQPSIHCIGHDVRIEAYLRDPWE
jgi:diaminohydroxyphosphoribosylaminopyrimidine deaminase/5-amino-6-(5-phosphoribosylamino)uracil reductase